MFAPVWARCGASAVAVTPATEALGVPGADPEGGAVVDGAAGTGATPGAAGALVGGAVAGAVTGGAVVGGGAAWTTIVPDIPMPPAAPWNEQ